MIPGWRGVALVTLLGFAAVACGSGPAPTAQPVTITVAAAADLRYALEEIVEAYEAAAPGVDVVVTYGSSGNFASQIPNGAPFDVFFSADIDYPRRLEAAGLVSGTTRAYAVGRLVVWVRDPSVLDVEALGIQALRDASVRRIAIANPEHAPYGRAAVAAMERAGLYGDVADRLVLGENISQAAQFIESGAADIGLIALSLAIAPTLADRGRFAPIPGDMHPSITQGVVVLERATDPAAAGAFVDHVLGPAGREVLQRYGFEAATP